MRCTWDIKYIKEYGSNSKFLSTGSDFQVRVQVSEYGSHTRDLFSSRFPSTGPGFQVRVQVPKYGSSTRVLFRSRFPSTVPGSQLRILNIEIGFLEIRLVCDELYLLLLIFSSK